jgi:hypothetical protein
MVLKIRLKASSKISKKNHPSFKPSQKSKRCTHKLTQNGKIKIEGVTFKKKLKNP